MGASMATEEPSTTAFWVIAIVLAFLTIAIVFYWSPP
jgi:hypothetical protein